MFSRTAAHGQAVRAKQGFFFHESTALDIKILCFISPLDPVAIVFTLVMQMQYKLEFYSFVCRTLSNFLFLLKIGYETFTNIKHFFASDATISEFNEYFNIFKITDTHIVWSI